MKQLLLILTLLTPTMAMGEVVEMTCTLNGDTKTTTTYQFDLDKKTVSYSIQNQFIRKEYPLEVFDGYLLWIEKYGWDQNEPAVFAHILNRKTLKLYLGGVWGLKGGNSYREEWICTKRI